MTTALDLTPFAAPAADEPTLRLPARALATRTSRLIASAIDGLVMFTFMALAERLLVSPLVSFQIAGGVILVVVLGGQGRMLARTGQTVGRRALGIRIQTLDGHPPGWLRGVVLRNVIHVAAVLTPWSVVVYGIDASFMYGPARRALHDRLAGTQVVRA